MIKKIIIGGVVLSVGYLIFHFVRQKNLLANSKFRYGGMRINKLGLNDTNLSVKLYIQNSSSVPFTLTNQRYDLYLDDKYITTVTDTKPTYIAANYESSVFLTFDFDPLKVIGIAVPAFIAKLTDKSNVKVKIVSNLGVQSGMLVFGNVSFTTELPLSDLMKNPTA